MKQNHLCLLFHCLLRDDDPTPAINPELFVRVGEAEKMIRSLKDRGYKFGLPGAEVGGAPTCSITFDDGYYNNSLFLDIAERHAIPFIVFVSSYNILNELPYIWDIWSSTRKEAWTFSNHDYKGLYEDIQKSGNVPLKNDHYRPFTVDELRAFAESPWVYLAPHGHTHQPLVGKYLANLEWEIGENLQFVSKFKQTLLKDFSLPCGFSNRSTRRRLLEKFERVYTIDGGANDPAARVISRISLINPEMGRGLNEQIDRSFQLKVRAKKKWTSIKHSVWPFRQWLT